jgi:ribonuclease HI
MFDPRALQLHTDGSAYRNPGHSSGCAVIVRYPDHLGREDEVIVDFGCPQSTNQRMELMACVEGLRWVCENAPWKDVTCVLIITDSQYVTKHIAAAVFWKQNDWRNASGKPMLNSDLWDDLVKVRIKVGKLRLRVQFVWSAGKKTDIGKRVDKLAKAAANRGGNGRDSGYKPGSVSRTPLKGIVALPFPAGGTVSVIRACAKKPVLRGEEMVTFEVFDELTGEYKAKFNAFAAPDIAFELHRWHLYRVRFNSDPKYPRIIECVEEVFAKGATNLESVDVKDGSESTK